MDVNVKQSRTRTISPELVITYIYFTADVFVIYVGDAGSEKLMPGLLYNPQLTTVTEHFELKQLEKRDRVITVNERFTITQREKVAEAIA